MKNFVSSKWSNAKQSKKQGRMCNSYNINPGKL